MPLAHPMPLAVGTSSCRWHICCLLLLATLLRKGAVIYTSAVSAKRKKVHFRAMSSWHCFVEERAEQMRMLRRGAAALVLIACRGRAMRSTHDEAEVLTAATKAGLPCRHP